MVMLTKEGSTAIVNFMTRRAGVLVLGRGHKNHIVNMHFFSFRSPPIYSQTKIRQTRYIVMLTKEGSTKIVNSMTPWARVFVLGRGHISHIVEMRYFF